MKAHLLAVLGVLAFFGFIELTVLTDGVAMMVLLGAAMVGGVYFISLNIANEYLRNRERKKKRRYR